MSLEIVKFSYLSEFIHLPVLRLSDNKRIGKVVDLAASTAQVYPRVTGLMVQMQTGPFAATKKQLVYMPWSTVKRIVFKEHLAVDDSMEAAAPPTHASEHEILLCKTFLDKQIISTTGYKVVRVNDLQLLIEDRAKESTNLWVVHIDIGMRGILRRLGFLKPVNSAFRWVTDRDMKDQFISWKNVQPTSTTSVLTSVEMKTDASKLSEIHPADLADILEDLGTDERTALIESLDYFTAAQTLQEMQFKNRLQILESLEPQNLAPIINEMQMDEAVDLLDAIDPEKRHAVYVALPIEKVSELKDLSRLSAYSVGSIMNTDFITAKATETVSMVLDRIRVECEKAELYRYAFVLDEQERLKGVLSLRNLLMSDPTMVVVDIMTDQPICVELDTRIKRVAQLFFKYNFEAIPVVDEEHRMQGVVSYRDAVAALYPEIKEEETV